MASDQMQSSIALSADILNRYAGEYEHVAAGTKAIIRREGDKLLFDVQGSAMEPMSFVARSETRFASPPIFTLDFQLNGEGKVTGANWETAGPSGPQRISLERR